MSTNVVDEDDLDDLDLEIENEDDLDDLDLEIENLEKQQKL